MSKNMDMSENVDMTNDVEMEKRYAAIRTALFLLAFSLALPVTHYLWQACCS
ncbi:hypothetical protein C8R32_1303 [Nitrosospira sp. Nsp5]|uniref:Methane/ammonia monooxygenase subunit C n=1 Tax=Nitrosospira multiformis TaxID=1231 RepID=A0ABY0TCS1_9PROT|nr:MULTISPECIES: hypothetical protein [Nitrosospira]PTR05108.1 hypothetical protein C8R32_1303 [Nitrosospira sp. Nsp5]SDQ63212.1 hypothetical protein SAMN05216402_1626 [Nitrosospira multiformis]